MTDRQSLCVVSLACGRGEQITTVDALPLEMTLRVSDLSEHRSPLFRAFPRSRFDVRIKMRHRLGPARAFGDVVVCRVTLGSVRTRLSLSSASSRV